MDKSRSSLTKPDGTHIVKTKRSLADGGVLTKTRTEKYIDEEDTACPDSLNNTTRTHVIKTHTKRMNNTGGLSFTTTTKEKMMHDSQPITHTKVLPDGSRIIKTKKITNGPIITTTTVHLTNMPKKSKKQEDDVTQSMPELYIRDSDDNEPPLPLQYLTVESEDDKLRKVKAYDNSMPELYTREDGDDDAPPVPLQYMIESNSKAQENEDDPLQKIYIRKTDDTPPPLPFQYINEDDNDETEKKIHGRQGRYDDDDNEIDCHILDSMFNRKTDDAVAGEDTPVNEQARGTNPSRLSESVSDEEEGLAVARPVYSEEGGSIYDAEEYTPIDKVPFYKQRRYIMWTIIALLMISVIVAVSVVFATKTAVVDDQGQPISQESERETYLKSYIRKNVLQRDASWDEMAPDDPRRQAFDWVVYDDEQAELERPDERLSQRYLLALLAFALDSLEKHTKYWLSSEISECNWYGVSCVDDQVVALNMTDNNLIGMVPPEIGMLNLTKLLMSNNCLVGTIPSELGVIEDLVQLDLSYNGLSGTFPTDTSKLRNLVKLNLAEQYYNDHSCTSSNGIVINTMYSQGLEVNGQNMGITGSILGPQIGNMMSLEEIVIQGNYFSGSISSEIGSLRQLAILSAGVNNISGPLPKEITQLTNLRQLLVDSNHISGSLPDEIGNMESLENVLLHTCSLTGKIPESLYNLSNLTVLYLNMNDLEGTISTNIGKISKLSQLALSDNPSLNGALPSELGLCMDLTYLHLSNTKTGIVPDEVCKLTNEKLKSDIPYEYFKADCSPMEASNTTKDAFFKCSCCQTCCDHSTKICKMKEG